MVFPALVRLAGRGRKEPARSGSIRATSRRASRSLQFSGTPAISARRATT